MGIKSLYVDNRIIVINSIVANRDISAMKELKKDRNNYNRYSSGWQKVNLDIFIEKLGIKDKEYNISVKKRKISFFDDGKKYEIVCAIGAPYFRIRRLSYIDSNGVKHGDTYVGIDLKEPYVSGKLSSKEQKAERQRLTHFKMTYKKEVQNGHRERKSNNKQ